MTNQTNLDYLFKLTAPFPERAAGGVASTTRTRKAFDDHLVNASASAPGSASPNAARATPSEGAPPENVATTSHSRPDNGSAESTTTGIAPANGDVNEDADAQAISGVDDETATDVSSSEGESAIEDAADLLTASGGIAAHPAQTSQDDAMLSEEQLSGAATADGNAGVLTRTSPDNADRNAEEASAGESTNAKRARADITSNVKIDSSVQAPSSDASPELAARQANTTNSVAAATNAGKPQNESARDRSAVSESTVDVVSALGNNADAGAQTKPIKAIRVGRRGAEQSKESPDKRRTSDASAINRADANTSQNLPASIAAANTAHLHPADSAGAGGASEEASRAVKPIAHNSDGVYLTARAQRSGAAGARRAHGGQPPDLTRVGASRFVGRVAKAVQTAQDRGGLVQLRLSPPELGSLRLELTMQNGVMTASVETETSAARQVLLDHLPALRERLAEQNIRIERFDVDVRQENSGGQADPKAQQEQRQHHPQQFNARHTTGRAATTQAPTSDALIGPTRLTNNELNLLA